MNSPQIPEEIQQITQPSAPQEDFLTKYFLWIAIGLGAIYYFKILEPLQIAGIIGAIIIYYIFIKANKQAHPILEYKPLNLEIETPKIITAVNKFLQPTGIIALHQIKTEGYPDYSEPGEWQRVQYYLLEGQKRDGSKTKILVKQGVISRLLIKIVPDWEMPEGTNYAWTGEKKYPFVAVQPTKMYEPTKTRIEIVTPDRTKEEEKEEEVNGK